MEAGSWAIIVDSGRGSFLGKFKEKMQDDLTGEQVAVFSECVQLESVNVPVPTKGGMAVGNIGVQTSPIPWRPLFDRETLIHVPVSRIVRHIPVSEDDVTKFRTEKLAHNKG